MNNVLSPDTQATLLLVGRFEGSSTAKPLTSAEYNRLAKQLQELQLRPSDLLKELPKGLAIESERLSQLLGRGASLAISVERWSRIGIKIVGRSDPTYPIQLKEKLRGASAPILFLAGKTELLEAEAVCIVGSRDATQSGLVFASKLGALCAKDRLAVVSGDARGIDRAAMTGSLERGGTVIGVLVDSISKAVLSKRNRDAILSGQLLLICPYGADARFTVPNAMDRNKYLYALASAAVVVDSDVKGGTWSGAIENAKRGWCNGFVRDSSSSAAGNSRLIEHGLKPIKNLMSDLQPNIRGFLFSEEVKSEGQLSFPAAKTASTEAPRTNGSTAFFNLFVGHLTQSLAQSPKTEATIAEELEIESSQTKIWLKKAEEEKLVRRLSSPTRFELISDIQ